MISTFEGRGREGKRGKEMERDGKREEKRVKEGKREGEGREREGKEKEKEKRKRSQSGDHLWGDHWVIRGQKKLEFENPSYFS
jgi:hypothetical protein